MEELFLLLLFLSFSLKSFLKGLIEDSDIRGGSRKKIFGEAWSLIIWQATMTKRNLSEITIEPINSTISIWLNI